MSELDRLLGERRRTNPATAAAITEVVILNDFCQALARAAVHDGNSEEEGERVFDAIFSLEVSQRISVLARSIGVPFEYCDPDTTYEADSLAFIRALYDYTKGL